MKVFQIIILFLLALAAASCVNDTLCVDENTNRLKVTFKKQSNGEDTLVSFSRITATITNDSFPNFQDTTAVQFELPLSPIQERTEFIFQDTSGNLNTLTAYYDIKSRIIDIDCAPEFTYTLRDSTTTTFDSLRFIDFELLNETQSNVEIYL